jgi:hypothetical protein
LEEHGLEGEALEEHGPEDDQAQAGARDEPPAAEAALELTEPGAAVAPQPPGEIEAEPGSTPHPDAP